VQSPVTAVWPVPEQYLPGGHIVHYSWDPNPVVAPYVPAGQSIGAEPSPLQYLPWGQPTASVILSFPVVKI